MFLADALVKVSGFSDVERRVLRVQGLEFWLEGFAGRVLCCVGLGVKLGLRSCNYGSESTIDSRTLVPGTVNPENVKFKSSFLDPRRRGWILFRL